MKLAASPGILVKRPRRENIVLLCVWDDLTRIKIKPIERPAEPLDSDTLSNVAVVYELV